jgi:ribulose-5-phosphate 4-epimerase/fuculose-1-phosphate aldolase
MNAMTDHVAMPATAEAARTDDDNALRTLRVHLAAALRLAVRDELDEGIDNHFTACVPGRPGHYLIHPFRTHWSLARASELIVFNDEGRVVEGRQADLEMSAYCIHAPLHRLTGAQVVLHTHQTWALALNMLHDNRLLPATQTAAFMAHQIAYDDHYDGTADLPSEGERLAAVLGDKPILFMKNHGVLVTGATVAQAYRRLYKLERACRTQVLAMATGRDLAVLAPAIVHKVLRPAPGETHSAAERERLYFTAMMQVLDRDMPGYET